MNIFEFFKDKLNDISYMVSCSSRYIGLMLINILPYVMLLVGLIISKYSIKVFIIKYWFVLLIPIAVIILSSYLRWHANKIGKGDDCPVPIKRLTEVDNDGMVSVKHDRLQEMILFVADVEDYLERKGYL